MRVLAFALLLIIADGCTTAAPPQSASPTTSTTSVPTPTVPVTTLTPGPSPSQARINVSDGSLTSSTGAYLYFQLPNDPRFRAITFDAQASGIVPLRVASTAIWSQSPGTPVVIGTSAYTRDGVTLGTVPWEPYQFTWSSEGRLMCALTPKNGRTGDPLRLETALIGQAPRVIASGFGIYGDNGVYHVLACDEGRDRVVAAPFGQGVAPGKLWVFRLSSGALVRSVDYQGRNVRWVAATADGALIAESEQVGAVAMWKATIRSADDGAAQATLDGIVQAFSSDNSLAVVATVDSTAVIEWKTGRKIWSATGTYGGALPEPGGKRLAIGIGFVGGSDQRDVYLVQPDGTSYLLPASVRVSLRY